MLKLMLMVGIFVFVYSTAMAIYFMPLIIAFRRHHPRLRSILVYNLLLGWTVVGWIIALRLSLKEPTATVALKTKTPQKLLLQFPSPFQEKQPQAQILLDNLDPLLPFEAAHSEQAFPHLFSLLEILPNWDEIKQSLDLQASLSALALYEGQAAQIASTAWRCADNLDEFPEERLEALLHLIQLKHPPTYRHITESLQEAEEDPWSERFGYSRFEDALDQLNEKDIEEMSPQELARVQTLLIEATQRQVNEVTRAKILRNLGEVTLAAGDSPTALRYFEEALALNPKIGVKKLATKIKQGLLTEPDFIPNPAALNTETPATLG